MTQPHLLLNNRTGWRTAQLDHVVVDRCGGDLLLAPAAGAIQPLTDAAGTLGGLVLPVGVAVDRGDRVYVLDGGTQHIKQFDPCTQAFRELPCVGGKGVAPRRFQDARAIAISRRDDLYVADFGNQRVQVVALKGLVLRDIWDLRRIAPSGVKSWKPSDIALAYDSRAYVSDYENGLVHIFDARGCWRAAWSGFVKPVHIAIDSERRVYVVEEGNTSVTVLDPDGKPAGQVTTRIDVDGRFRPLAIAVDPSGNLHISDTLYRTITVVCRAEGGTSIRETYSSGPAIDLTFDSAGNAVIADPFQKQIVTIPSQAQFATSGRIWSQGLDSRLYQCPWHRVAINASVPAGCQISVDTLTSESDKTSAEILTLTDDRWSTGQVDGGVGDGEWDCLIQSPPGRYLWLRITLDGEGPATAAIHQLRVYYPRQSSLQYLPAVFSQDPSGRAFLDQFLSIFDRFWDGFSERLTNIAALFDPAATPASPTAGLGDTDFLTWLASWIGLALDRHWPIAKRRLLLEQAHRLYALRGTPEGLRLHLRLYTGVEPSVLEHFKLRRWMFNGSARLGEQSELWGSDIVNRLQLNEHFVVGESQVMDTTDPLRDPFWVTAHRFSVFVPVKDNAGAVEQQTIQRIVEMAKPAHTLGDAILLRPRFRIGIQSYIGIDSMIGRYPAGVVEAQGKLGYDTILNAASEACPPDMRIGITSRIGTGSGMN